MEEILELEQTMKIKGCTVKRLVNGWICEWLRSFTAFCSLKNTAEKERLIESAISSNTFTIQWVYRKCTTVSPENWKSQEQSMNNKK